MPNYINRAKAVAAVVTANHREEIMESKRKDSLNLIASKQFDSVKQLKIKN